MNWKAFFEGGKRSNGSFTIWNIKSHFSINGPPLQPDCMALSAKKIWSKWDGKNVYPFHTYAEWHDWCVWLVQITSHHKFTWEKKMWHQNQINRPKRKHWYTNGDGSGRICEQRLDSAWFGFAVWLSAVKLLMLTIVKGRRRENGTFFFTVHILHKWKIQSFVYWFDSRLQRAIMPIGQWAGFFWGGKNFMVNEKKEQTNKGKQNHEHEEYIGSTQIGWMTASNLWM